MPPKGKKLSAKDEALLAVLSPMWQRIARGEVDLNQYTDEEILEGKIRMPDGRYAPTPRSYPDTFIQEQVKRGMRQAESKILDGSQKALDVYLEVLEDVNAPRADRLKAAQFFTDRFLGKDVVKVKVASEDKIEALFEALLNNPEALEPEE